MAPLLLMRLVSSKGAGSCISGGSRGIRLVLVFGGPGGIQSLFCLRSCVYMLDSIFVLLKFTLFIEFAEWPCPGHSAIAGQKDANRHLLGRTDLWPNAGHCFLLLFWEVPGTVLCFAGPAKQTWMMSSRVGQAQMPHPSFQSREFQ